MSLFRRRVPVVAQMSPVDCGAACLAMILGHYGRKTTSAECRERLGIGRDGANALQISRAAQSYGLRTRAYSLEPSALNNLPFPAIAHWSFNHFVVLERCVRGRIEIIDPALGRRAVNAAELDRSFTGVVLVLEPGAAFESRADTSRNVVAGYCRRLFASPGNRGVLAQIIACSFMLQLMGLAPPLLAKVLVDAVLPHHLNDVMHGIAIAIVLLVLSQAVASYLRSALLLYLQARLDSQIMLGFFEHVLSLPYSFFQRYTTGDLLMRLGSNAAVRETLTNQVISAALDGVLVFFYVALLLALQPAFGAAALVIGMLQVAVMLVTRGRLREATQDDLAASAESQTYLIEALSGIGMVKASGTEGCALEHWSNLFLRQLWASVRKSHLSSVAGTILSSLRIFSSLFLLWLSALQVLDGHMSLGTMLAVNAMSAAFLMPLASLVASAQQLHLAGAHLDRISDVLAAEPENAGGNGKSLQLTGRIDLVGLRFRYHPSGPLILRDVSLSIQPGQKVALVGRTGSGKSTLASLLLGFYKPEAGEILFDGQPLDLLDARAVRRQFGVVLQNPPLFSGSIRTNIAFADPSLSLDRVAEAAAIAEIDDEIDRLPMKYETVLTDGGSGLSGGQRQRLAIARALAHRPRILLLDEATSQLDTITESRLERNLSRLNNTRIVIAHRLSTVRDADVIVVLEAGMIVEHGTHEELMAQHGHYSAMVRSQTSRIRIAGL